MGLWHTNRAPRGPVRTSKNTMGLSLRMADFRSAFAFAGVLHATSWTPVKAAGNARRRPKCSQRHYPAS